MHKLKQNTTSLRSSTIKSDSQSHLEKKYPLDNWDQGIKNKESLQQK